MKQKKTIIFINQTVNDLFVDVVNEFYLKYSKVILITGYKNEEGIRKLETTIEVDRIIPYNRSNTLKRLFTWLYATLQIIFKIKLKYKGCDLFIVSNPPTAFWIPMFCKNKYSLLVYDIYPDVLCKSKILKERNILYQWWKKRNKKIYSRAENIYTIGDSMAKCIAQYIDLSKVTVIHNWADTDFLKPMNKKNNPFVIQHDLQNKFIVLYSGNIGNTHNVETLVKVAKLLNDNRDICFVIIGDGAKKKIIEKMIDEQKLSNCLLLPFQSMKMLPYSLSSADIGVISLDVSASLLSIPSKTYGMMAVGAALLCLAGLNSELAVLVSKYRLGAIYDPFDIKNIADYILELKNNPDKLLLYKKNARNAALNFTPINARKYVDSYKTD